MSGRRIRFFIFSPTTSKKIFYNFIYFFFFSFFQKHSFLSFLFFNQKNNLLCGRTYYFLFKEQFLNFNSFSKLQKFWHLTNFKNFSSPLRWFSYRFRVGCGVLLAKFSTYWIFRVIIFQSRLEFLVFFNKPSFLGVYKFNHYFNKVFYLIKTKNFWLRRVRNRYLRFVFYNKTKKILK